MMKPKPIQGSLAGLLWLALSLLPCVLRATAAQAECGLCYAELADGQRVVLPLESTEVQLDVTPGLLEATVTQTFTNRTDTALEATYLYPLPAEATLTRFELHFRDRVIESVVREKNTAKKEYEAAKAEGRKAALLEQRDPSLFSTAVANFLPGESVQVVIRFIQPLAITAKASEVRFPMTTGVKYFPAGAVPGAPGVAAATPPKVDAAVADEHHYYAFDILVSGFPECAIDSASHAIRVEDLPGGRERVGLAEEITIPDRDFVLRIAPRVLGEPASTVVTQRSATGSYGLLTVFPPQAETVARDRLSGRDVLFLLDRSGSMQGARITSAKLGLQGCLAMLDPTDCFQIVVFDDTFSFYQPTWTPADAEAVARADRYVGELGSGGGTMMQPALEAALDFFGTREAGRDRIVVFLTDGDVGNEAELLKLLQAKIGRTRLFTFGIGAAPNAYLIGKMAELGRGQARFIAEDDSIARELSDLFATLSASVLTDLHLTLVDENDVPVAAAVFPRTLPDVFMARPVQAVFAAEGAEPAAVMLEAQRDGVPVRLRLPFQGSELRGDGVAKQFGRMLYADLETQQRAAGLTADQREALERRKLETALQFQLVTAQTSRVAIDSEVSRKAGTAIDSLRVPQYNAADATGADAGIPMADGDIIVLSPFSVDSSESSGYVACDTIAGSRLRTALRDVASCVSVVTSEFLKDVGAVRTEDAVGCLTEPTEINAAQPTDRRAGLVDYLPILATFDPAQFERWTLDPGSPYVVDLTLHRAAFRNQGGVECGLGDGGLRYGRLSGNYSDGDRWAVLTQVSHLHDDHERLGAYSDARLKIGSFEIKGGGQWNRWGGFGSSRFGRLEATVGASDALQCRVAGAWSRLGREDPMQFRRDSATGSYDGLGFASLDLFTAPVRSVEDRVFVADVGGTLQQGGRHSYAVGLQWHERSMDWVSDPEEHGTTWTRRDLLVSVEDQVRFGPRERFSLNARGWWNRRAEENTTGGIAFGGSAEVVKGVKLFADFGRDGASPDLPSGKWQSEGGAPVAIALPVEHREVVKAGIQVNLFDDRLTGSVSLFDEHTDMAAYRDWAWEAAHPEGELTDTGRIDAIRYSAWPRWNRAGWRTQWSLNPLSNLTAVLKWYEDFRNDGPVHGGNRRGLFMTRYDFDGGMLKGVSIGGGFEYRNAVRFNDDRVLKGGIRWNLLLAYERRVFGPAPTEIRLTLRNLDGTSYQPTRFAADRGRQVLLSVSQEF